MTEGRVLGEWFVNVSLRYAKVKEVDFGARFRIIGRVFEGENVGGEDLIIYDYRLGSLEAIEDLFEDGEPKGSDFDQFWLTLRAPAKATLKVNGHGHFWVLEDPDQGIGVPRMALSQFQAKEGVGLADWRMRGARDALWSSAIKIKADNGGYHIHLVALTDPQHRVTMDVRKEDGRKMSFCSSDWFQKVS